MQFTAFLNLIRWKNLLLILYIQIVIKYLFFPYFIVVTSLSPLLFTLLVFSVICTTSAGYIINDIFDVETDKINKYSKLVVTKKISIITAKKWYLFFNTLGISLGVLLSLIIKKPTLSLLFFGTALLLYFYSKKLKSLPLIGNLTVAFLVSVNVLLLVFFDLKPSVKNNDYQFVLTTILLVSFFAFCLNLIREIVKDIEDVDGDYNMNMSTLPILIGRRRTKNVIAILCVFLLILLLLFVTYFASEYRIISLYTLGFIVIPMLYITSNITKAKSKKRLHKISSILKLTMLFGINIFIILSFSK